MQSKKAKAPPITNQTKILCFDLETNGLHGEAFAAGAIVIDATSNVLDTFTARTNIVGEVDEWVEQNVLPAISDMPITHKDSHEMREAFWQWYLQAEPKSDYVLVSNGYPVEYRFLLQCQEENLAERYWQHPFPILDLSSLLIQAGLDPTSKNKLLNSLVTKENFKSHHPLHDAKVSALAAFEAFRLTGKI